MEKSIKIIKRYSENFKEKVLSEIKSGRSYREVTGFYGLGTSTIQRWLKEKGIKQSSIEYIDLNLEENSIGSMPKKEEGSKLKPKDLENKVKMLEYELLLYKKLVEIAKRDYNLDLLKKLNTKPSKK